MPANLLRHHALRKVHGIGDGDDGKVRMATHWPIEELVHDCVLGERQLIQLIDQQDGALASRVGLREIPVEQLKRLLRCDPVAL